MLDGGVIQRDSVYTTFNLGIARHGEKISRGENLMGVFRDSGKLVADADRARRVPSRKLDLGGERPGAFTGDVTGAPHLVEDDALMAEGVERTEVVDVGDEEKRRGGVPERPRRLANAAGSTDEECVEIGSPDERCQLGVGDRTLKAVVLVGGSRLTVELLPDRVCEGE